MIGVDINNKLIERLNNYKIDIKEKKIEKLFFDLSKEKNFFSKSIIISDIYVICVPTPLKKNKPDISFVLNAVDSLIPAFKKW